MQSEQLFTYGILGLGDMDSNVVGMDGVTVDIEAPHENNSIKCAIEFYNSINESGDLKAIAVVMLLQDNSYITQYVKSPSATEGMILGGIELLKADLISESRGFDEEIRDW